MHGKPVDSTAEEPHAVTLQKHLLGYEFPETIMILADKTLTVHATAKKRELLSSATALLCRHTVVEGLPAAALPRLALNRHVSRLFVSVCIRLALQSTI
jgi:hypothetical protein